jgi:sialidase-1
LYKFTMENIKKLKKDKLLHRKLILGVSIIVLALWVTSACSITQEDKVSEIKCDKIYADTSLDGTSVGRDFGSHGVIDITNIYDTGRFPNVVVTTDGTVLAFWGNGRLRVRRSEDGGKSWGDKLQITDGGEKGGAAVVNETTGDILYFDAANKTWRSQDDGRTWSVDENSADVRSNEPVRVSGPYYHRVSRAGQGTTHGSESGITLQNSEYKGRLVMPARVCPTGDCTAIEAYSTAIFSDDEGETWQTGDPFPEFGTGEGAIVELSNGQLYYNSRSHSGRFDESRSMDETDNLRRVAWSYDGGRTWSDWSISCVLPDGGGNNRAYGLMGGLTRLPLEGRNVLLFSNTDTFGGDRENLTVWVSFDGGRTWPVKRLIYDGPSAYSSLATGRANTSSEGWVYIQFEGSDSFQGEGSKIARFNLAWVLNGKLTGDGSIPSNMQNIMRDFE